MQLFPQLKLYRMDIETYHAYLDEGLPFGEEQAMNLKKLLADESYASWHPLIQELLKYGKRIEQESVRLNIK